MKEYVELSLDRLPDMMEFLRGLLTQDGPVVVYSHCEVSWGVEGSDEWRKGWLGREEEGVSS